MLLAFLALIDAAPEVSETFGQFSDATELARLTAAIVPLLGDKRWARTASVVEWADRTPGPVKKAIGAQEGGMMGTSASSSGPGGGGRSFLRGCLTRVTFRAGRRWSC